MALQTVKQAHEFRVGERVKTFESRLNNEIRAGTVVRTLPRNLCVVRLDEPSAFIPSNRCVQREVSEVVKI